MRFVRSKNRRSGEWEYEIFSRQWSYQEVKEWLAGLEWEECDPQKDETILEWQYIDKHIKQLEQYRADLKEVIEANNWKEYI